ncbi:jacalin-related lectin 24 [Eutrema salsugineum]|uniref:jacalin-related lectin 24 n=1 Tax=Eutrema salsugineum TaxID=72664 RepID=UPI000CED32B3|nr:jacalin-related lectin 24 [Eutrema salsugineum]
MMTLRVLHLDRVFYISSFSLCFSISLYLLNSLTASDIKMIRAGPVGGNGSSNGEVGWDEKGRTMISQIYVSFDDELISSVQFGYLENGALVLSAKYGVSEGHNFRIVRLKQDEYVTGLSAVLGWNRGIKNLTFHTNCGMHGPIGRSDNKYGSGSKVEIDPAICDRREFGGFFGSYNKYNHYLSSIGIYVSPIARPDTVVKRENI